MQNIRRKLTKQPAIWQIALALFWAALFTATHIPLAPSAPVTIPWGDKLVHFVAYAVLAILFATTWQVSAGRLTLSHLRWAWIVLALYGAIDEWTQSLAGRNTSLADWLCDATGALVGIAAFAFIMNWKGQTTGDSR